MGYDYSYGNRRRRIQLLTTSQPSTTTSSPLPAQMVVGTIRKPSPSRVRKPIIVRTPLVNGTPGYPPGSVTSNVFPPVFMVRQTWDHRVRPHPAIQIRSEIQALPIDGVPNVTVVRFQKPNRRITQVVKRQGQIEAFPYDGTPNRIVVPNIKRRSSRSRPIFTKTVATTGLGFVPPNDPVIASYVRKRPPGKTPIIIKGQPPATIIKPSPLVIVKNIALLRRLAKPRVPVVFKQSTPRNNQIIKPLGLIVPIPGRKKPSRKAIVQFSPQQIPAVVIPSFDPVVVPVTNRRVPRSVPITAQRLGVDNTVPVHDPLSRIYVVPAPRSRHYGSSKSTSTTQWNLPILVKMKLQETSNSIEPPYDIIAASIAWLRTNSQIVEAFGDSPATKVYKFTSDLEPRSTDAPYAVFYEPQEVESFETTDGSKITSEIDGVYRIDVFSDGKLLTRQLCDLVGQSLTDANLQFTSGILIYIRRSQRQYPTVEVPGTGTNATLFKRMIEFEYKFETY